jgi:hypothetical protein
MNRKNLAFLSAAIGLLALGGVAFAQSTTLPTASTIHQTTDRMQVVPSGQPSARSVYASPAQITVTKNYIVSPAADGLHNNSPFSYTFGNTTARMLFESATTASYAYVTMAANPSDGTEQCVYSKSAVTLFYPVANTGQTLSDAATTIAAAGHVCYIYGLSNATWYRTE